MKLHNRLQSKRYLHNHFHLNMQNSWSVDMSLFSF